MNSIARSLQKNKIGILLMVTSALFTALGQLFWKISGGGINLYLIVGFFLYGLGAVFMIVAFRFGSLSVLHPLLSLGYVFGLFFGSIFLDETLTMKILLGTGLIIIGAVCIGGGDH
ncbi:EamA family transporter [Oceanobacillus senegalensis]|uniref:EamA family transporter n=1 Tax=Oceanobacillus senegalensis TaxID=1936063 RepID=UPI000A30A152|nr:EamA family transporter [Oceanobacillus senegalensis]